MAEEVTLDNLAQQIQDLHVQLAAERERSRNLEQKVGAQQTEHRERLVYLPKDRKIKNFSGIVSGDAAIRIEDWVDDCQSYFAARSFSVKEQVDFITSHLEDQAREEIKYRPRSVRENPAEIYKVLLSVFGNQYSVTRLLREFYDRKQKPTENIRTFSLALMDLLDRVTKTDARCVPDQNKCLCDQFAENVLDRDLRRHLKHVLRHTPELSFLDLREEALKWTEDEETEANRSKFKTSKPVVYETSAEVSSQVEDKLSRLTEVVEKQQDQIKELTETLKSRQRNSKNVKCYNCDEKGHIARNCPRPKRVRQNVNSQSLSVNVNESNTSGVDVSTVHSQSDGNEQKSDMVHKTIGTCPSVDVIMGGVSVPCLLDTGSMVTMVTESFFHTHFANVILKNTSSWLSLRAANGLDIPYIGYFEVDVEVDGCKIADRGILVIKDSSSSSAMPGIVGMNVLSHCPQLLPSQSDITKCSNANVLGFARVAGGNATVIPAYSMKCVAVTGNHDVNTNVVIEPLRGNYPHLPKNLLVTNTVTTCDSDTKGIFNVRIVNVGQEPVVLKPKTKIGLIHNVDSVLSDSGVEIVKTGGNEAVVRHISAAKEVVEDSVFSEFSVQQPFDVSQSGLVSENEADITEVCNFFTKFRTVFAESDDDLGYCDTVKHRIPTVDDNPVKQNYRRIPPSQYQEVKTHIQKLLSQGIIKRSNSPYASPIVVVRKRDGTVRLCVDYRQLNCKTRKDAFPMPDVEQTFTSLSGSKWVSTMDLACGYNQVAMDESDMEKTAFVTPMGLFHYTRMPMGLSTAPATFQRLMQLCLDDQLFETVLVFLDDIIVFSKIVDDHLHHLEYVFMQLKKHGLKLKKQKCHFFRTEVKFLGHVISRNGISTDPEKVKCVKEWPRPKTVRQLRSFLGLCSYYRRFMQGFAKTAAPLHALVSTGLKTRGFPWAWKHEQAFMELKCLLTQAPVLGFADFSKPFILETDASLDGLGAILCQEQDGCRRVIAYASRGLRVSEKNSRNYSSLRLELLALKWAVADKFKDYLLGQKVTVFTDSNPLSYLKTAKLGAVEQRWASQLAIFELDIRYKPGHLNRAADCLSRCPERKPEVEDPDEVAEVCMVLKSTTSLPVELYNGVNQAEPVTISSAVVSVNSVSTLPTLSISELRQHQLSDTTVSCVIQSLEKHQKPTCTKLPYGKLLVHQWKRLFLGDDGVLRRRVQDPVHGVVHQVVLPVSLKSQVLESVHDKAGHQGMERTYLLARQRVYWPNMWQEIKSYCQECQRCSMAKLPQPKPKVPMCSVLASRPLQIIATDFTALEKSSDGRENVLVITDIFTKYSQAIPTRDQSATTVARCLG